MKYVFYLHAEGPCFLTGSRRMIDSTTCFSTKEKAEFRIETFKKLLVEKEVMDDVGFIDVTVKTLELVE